MLRSYRRRRRARKSGYLRHLPVANHRLPSCHNLTRLHLLRGRNPGLTRTSDYTLALRFNVSCHVMRNPRLLDLALINSNHIVVNRSSVNERVVVHDRDAVVHALVNVGHVRDMVDGHVVVDICDLHVGDASISDVYVLNVTRASPIPGNEYFSRPQREPSNATAHANSNAKSSTSDKCNQSRRVNRSDSYRSRNPAPAAACKCPSTIVERSEAPRLILHPSPSPRPHICPVSIAVWSPAIRHTHRRPHVAVSTNVVPAAIVVEVF